MRDANGNELVSTNTLLDRLVVARRVKLTNPKVEWPEFPPDTAERLRTAYSTNDRVLEAVATVYNSVIRVLGTCSEPRWMHVGLQADVALACALEDLLPKDETLS